VKESGFEESPSNPMPPEAAERVLQLFARWAVRRARNAASKAREPCEMPVTGGVSKD
jgi:hypothetical protein